MNNEYKLHQCENLPGDVQIIFSMDEYERKCMVWRMFIRRTADEKALDENHHLEQEGDIIWETSIEIIFCPFCGEQLFDLKTSPLEDFGKFHHFDCSKWYGKRS